MMINNIANYNCTESMQWISTLLSEILIGFGQATVGESGSFGAHKQYNMYS